MRAVIRQNVTASAQRKTVLNIRKFTASYMGGQKQKGLAMQPNDMKAARLSLGMSQRQLAETLRMGLDGGRAVRRWESGDRPISGPASVAIEAMLTGWRPA